jgi:hypothetical protein
MRSTGEAGGVPAVLALPYTRSSSAVPFNSLNEMTAGFQQKTGILELVFQLIVAAERGQAANLGGAALVEKPVERGLPPGTQRSAMRPSGGR